MADEVSTVLELEVKGYVYLLKGTIAAIKTLIKQLNAFHNWYNESQSKGAHSWNYIKAWSKDTPQVIQIPDNLSAEEWQRFCKQNNIPYCDTIPDLDLTDRRTPVVFRSQDIILIQQFIKPYVDELNKELETEKSGWEMKEDELNQIIRTSTNPEEIKKAKVDLENVQCAKAQLQKVIDKNDEYTRNGNAMSFFDYLKQGENTELARDPSLALAKLNEGIQISKEYSMSDAMMLIRDPSLIPEGNTIYLTCTDPQKMSSLTVERKFSVDENGMAVSHSVICRDGKELGSFSDEGLTPSEYKVKLTTALEGMGVSDIEIEKYSFRADLSESSHNAYAKYENDRFEQEKVLLAADMQIDTDIAKYLELGENAEPNAVAAIERGNLVKKVNEKNSVTSEDARRFEKLLTADRVNRIEEAENSIIQIDFDASRLEMYDNMPSYNVEGVGLVAGISQRKDAEGNFKVAIHADRSYNVISDDGTKRSLKGNEIRAILSASSEDRGIAESQVITAGRRR